MKLNMLATFALALVLHLALGWAWTLGAGVVGGAWAGRRGWMVGLTGVGLDWLVLVLYNYIVAPEPTAEMARVMGALLGGWSGGATVVLTLLIGGLLGALGGAIGTQGRLLVEGTKAPGVS